MKVTTNYEMVFISISTHLSDKTAKPMIFLTSKDTDCLEGYAHTASIMELILQNFLRELFIIYSFKKYLGAYIG